MQKALISWGFLRCFDGDPNRIRTCNPRSRNPLLYPVELWDRRGLLALPLEKISVRAKLSSGF